MNKKRIFLTLTIFLLALSLFSSSIYATSTSDDIRPNSTKYVEVVDPWDSREYGKAGSIWYDDGYFRGSIPMCDRWVALYCGYVTQYRWPAPMSVEPM